MFWLHGSLSFAHLTRDLTEWGWADAMRMQSWTVGVCALLTAGAAQGAGAEQTYAIGGSWFAAGGQGPKSVQGPLRPGWLTHSLSEGVELRYLPLAVTYKDYPKAATRAGVEGTTLLNLQLDPSGRLIGCSTARSSGSQDLDERACELYRQRGRFELRGATQPVTAQAPVKWMLLD